MKRRPVKRSKRSSDAVLADIEEITIRLENGQTQSFNIAVELEVPGDPIDLVESARQSHARFAFWAYQTARAMGALRRCERELQRLEGETYLLARGHYESIRPAIPRVETAQVRSVVDADESVNQKRDEVDKLREQWSMLGAVRDAMEHRTHLLRRLLAQDQEAQRG